MLFSRCVKTEWKAVDMTSSVDGSSVVVGTKIHVWIDKIMFNFLSLHFDVQILRQATETQVKKFISKLRKS